MKKIKNFCFFALASAMAIVAFASCDDDKHCDDGAPYWCSTAESCCAYRYNDGHGTCFESMEGCRRGGYACEVCHAE